MSDKSQLKAEIFNAILRHWRIRRDFYAKKINKPALENACGRGRV
ncbi:hypothetical protein B8P98_23595 [Klebsiella quasivariicola]|nr:hypothetical protein B8P98_23595 [Klebsiella quasivariicola]